MVQNRSLEVTSQPCVVLGWVGEPGRVGKGGVYGLGAFLTLNPKP